MSTPKVLHVLWSARLGGIARLVLNLCRHQQSTHLASSADVLVMTTQGELKSGFIQSDIGFHELGLRSGLDLNPGKFLRCIALMKQYDAIHLHAFHPLTAWAALRSGRRVVFTEHGNFGLHRSPGLRGHLVRRLKSVFLRKPNVRITCNSQFTLDTTHRLYGTPNKSMEVVYNGVPLLQNEFSSDKRSGEFTIASIGRLARVKRFDRVIDAFLKAEMPNSRLILLGEGPEEKTLKNLAQKSKPEYPIEFRAGENAHALIEGSDLCILGSEGEAFGLVAIEAYQAGKRVLVFEDGGGLAEIVKPFDPSAVCRDTSSMAEKIRFSQKDHIYRSRAWTESARKYAAGFSLDKMASTFNRLYQS